MKKYTAQHEWIDFEDPEIITVGITDYAQGQLGDVIFVELPSIGKTLSQNQEAAVVESVKAASEVYSPLSGTIIEVNEKLLNQPEIVNTSAEKEGWFFKLKPSHPEEINKLMDYDTYMKTQ